jgi:5-(carboxyamino)imidazole ribonucleotide synthase
MLYRPGITIGILGGGQLGQMLIQAAIPYDLRIKVLDPDPKCSSAGICHELVLGSFADEKTVLDFAEGCDLLTVEIEHVHVGALETLEKKGLSVYPRPSTLKIVQDKGLQKLFYRQHAIPTADFVLVENKIEIESHASMFPVFQKSRTQGYDGKGVVFLKDAENLEKAFSVPSVLEKQVLGAREISILVARNISGEMKVFPAVEMLFHPESHLVETLIAPADLSPIDFEKASELAKKIAKQLDHVGVLAVELFFTKEKTWLVNEIAPRPHNSGHHTIRANITSQYEQHLRAITDMPLGQTDSLKLSAMVNLLGEKGNEGSVDYEGLEKVLSLPGVSVHLYGKTQTRPMRKMGHVTILGESSDELTKKIHYIQQHLKVLAKSSPKVK